MCIKSPGLVHLMPEIFYCLTHIRPFPIPETPTIDSLVVGVQLFETPPLRVHTVCAFFVWLPLLRMISSVFTQVDANGKILQFLRLNRIAHMHNSYHTSYFSCLHIFNNSEINTGVQMSLETLI